MQARGLTDGRARRRRPRGRCQDAIMARGRRKLLLLLDGCRLEILGLGGCSRDNNVNGPIPSGLNLDVKSTTLAVRPTVAGLSLGDSVCRVQTGSNALASHQGRLQGVTTLRLIRAPRVVVRVDAGRSGSSGMVGYAPQRLIIRL
jgi:hypothetical protein